MYTVWDPSPHYENNQLHVKHVYLVQLGTDLKTHEVQGWVNAELLSLIGLTGNIMLVKFYCSHLTKTWSSTVVTLIIQCKERRSCVWGNKTKSTLLTFFWDLRDQLVCLLCYSMMGLSLIHTAKCWPKSEFTFIMHFKLLVRIPCSVHLAVYSHILKVMLRVEVSVGRVCRFIEAGQQGQR